MNNIKLAVIGSCVSRDAFNSNFIKDYKDYYQCVFTQNHMSMISLMSDSIPFQPYSVLKGDINDFNKKILITELLKSPWNSMRISQPDFLILDLYPDVYFGVRKIGTSYITNKTWLFKKTPFYSTLELGETYKPEKDFDEYFKIWKSAIDKFMEKMKLEFPNTKIILNKIEFTDDYIETKSNKIKKISKIGKYRKIDVDQINAMLFKFYDYFEDNYSYVETINYDKKYTSIDNHFWEVFYVHYTQDFYEDFTHKLLMIILKDLYKYKNTYLISNNTEQTNIKLLKNGDFSQGKLYWSYWQDVFDILPPEEDQPDLNVLSVTMSGLEQDRNAQIWSHPIEIDTKGLYTFKLTFEIKVDKIEEIDSNKLIFSLRTFNTVDTYLQKDCDWYKNIKVDQLELKNNTWSKIELNITPEKGKYIKLGPYLMRNGNVSWRNIQFKKLN
ncbi:DUF6270 domain-containing protein [Paraliobacillus salinarum]|uniref:DUF6270 domain-containing protein n=1 Tax=Paraliobacillus salinarum TaxID=1158996 RepID=UPI0015F35E64|nr:DUF6270 domain-containing protein [Paraliobacillus salinarum]